MGQNRLLIFGFTLVFIIFGCDSGDSGTTSPETGAAILTFNNLRPLPGDYHLEGWVVMSDLTTLSLGKFTVGSGGKLFNLAGEELITRRFDTSFPLDSARIAYITIEPPDDVDDSPSTTRLMGGLFVEGSAELRTTDVEGIEDALILARGNYIIETPTNGPDSFEQSGIWFVNLTGGPPARGLRITTPIPGWKHQGWVDIDGVPLNMGVISHHSQPDDSNIYSGPQPGYNYPGEDFLTNAPPSLTFPLSLAGVRVTISLEPDPDPDPERSQLILFEATVPETPESIGTTYDMTNLVDTWPTARMVIIRQ